MNVRTGMLVLSIALNVALVAVVALGDGDSERAGSSVPVGGSAQASVRASAPASAQVGAPVPGRGATSDGSPRSRTDAASYLRELLELGLGLDETKPLLLDSLQSQLPARPASLDAYWEPDLNARHVAFELARLEATDGMRQTLVALYGPDVRDDPAFASVFRPLDSRYPFMTSAQQIAVRRYRLEQRLTQLRNPVPMFAADGGPRPATTAIADRRRLVDELGELLEPQALERYLFLESPLAAQIRAAGLDLTTAEFQQVFRILNALETGAGDPEQRFAGARESLRHLLGAARYTELWAARDPMYAAMRAAGERLGLSENMTLSAYEIVNDAQDEMLRAVRFAEADPERSRRDIDGALAARNERLAGLVGTEAADALSRAFARQALQMSRQRLE